MRLWRGAVLVGMGAGTVVGLVVLGAPAAGADCSGPTVDYQAGPVDRGDEITVTGSSFGDNCYDTGPPPPGQGVLGEPLDGIEVVVVQGDVETLVAEGAADDDYEFTVDVVVPSTLEPGEARLEVRYGPGTGFVVDLADAPLVVSDAPASGDDATATFGPGAAGTSSGESGEPSSGGSGESGEPAESAAAPAPADDAASGWTEPGRWVVAALVLAAVVGIGSMVVVRRR